MHRNCRRVLLLACAIAALYLLVTLFSQRTSLWKSASGDDVVNDEERPRPIGTPLDRRQAESKTTTTEEVDEAGKAIMTDHKDDNNKSKIHDCCPGRASCEEMVQAILPSGNLSQARRVALSLRNQFPDCEKGIAGAYVRNANAWLDGESWLDTAVSSGGNIGGKVDQSSSGSSNRRAATTRAVLPTVGKYSLDCWTPGVPRDGSHDFDLEQASGIVVDRWDKCCSQLEPLATATTTKWNNPQEERTNLLFDSSMSNNGIHAEQQDECVDIDPTTHQRKEFCCSFFRGSLSHLKLPLLHEISLHLLLGPTAKVHANASAVERSHAIDLHLEQDGFLRKFDTAAVLWPTGYMLSLCLADPQDCGIGNELTAAIGSFGAATTTTYSTSPILAIELGAGIGAPSIVLGQWLQRQQQASDDKARVVATDRARHALALLQENAQNANVSLSLARIEDHANVTQLNQVKEQTNNRKGYAIVLGSSLQGLFDFQTQQPQHPLWKVLDNLLDQNNPHAIAVLAHVEGAVVPPRSKSTFELVKTVSGNHFQMRTRSGDDSDFVISLYRRVNSDQEQERHGEGEL